jgi:hypothetical protein
MPGLLAEIFDGATVHAVLPDTTDSAGQHDIADSNTTLPSAVTNSAKSSFYGEENFK